MKRYIRDIIAEVEKISGEHVVFIPSKGRHSKIQVNISGTYHMFPVPGKNFRAGCEKNNFYSQMRRKINDRIEKVKDRQQLD